MSLFDISSPEIHRLYRLLVRVFVGLFGLIVTAVILKIGSDLWRFHISAPREYHHCIVRQMPGVANSTAVATVDRVCSRFSKRTKVLSWELFIESAEECTLKYAKATPNENAAAIIANSCATLFPAMVR